MNLWDLLMIKHDNENDDFNDPLVLNPFTRFELLYSAKLSRYSILAERSAWKFSPIDIITLRYLEKFYLHARIDLITLPEGQQMSLCYIILALVLFSRQINDIHDHLLGLLRTLLNISHVSCLRRTDHFLWLLQVVNETLGILKHACAMVHSDARANNFDQFRSI